MNMKHEEDPGGEEIQIAGITYSGGDGSAPGEAIVIGGARSHAEGIRAEKRYLARHFGEEGSDWRLQRQSLFVEDNRVVDELTVENAPGDTETLYFEVSDFFRSGD
jgi:hypothetical protein